LIFTVEQAGHDATTPFQLNPSGRYAHTQAYVESALRTASLDLRSLSVRALRIQAGQPVAALLARAATPASPNRDEP